MAREHLQSNEVLVAAIQSSAGDRCTLMEQLYKQNNGIIRKMAYKAAHDGDLFDDLLQDGYIALENAVNCFDPAAGVKFVSYFGAALKWHFGRVMRVSSMPVKLSAHIYEQLTKYKATKEALEKEQSGKVRPVQVAAAMGIDAKQAGELELLLYQLHAVALDEPIDESGEVTAGDLIPDGCDVAGEVCDDAEREFNRRLLDDALQRDLDETARQVVLRYYGGEQLRDIADTMGLSYQQASDERVRAIQVLRRDKQLLANLRSCDLYQYSFQRFKNSGLSSVEFIVERIEHLHEGA